MSRSCGTWHREVSYMCAKYRRNSLSSPSVSVRTYRTARRHIQVHSSPREHHTSWSMLVALFLLIRTLLGEAGEYVPCGVWSSQGWVSELCWHVTPFIWTSSPDVSNDTSSFPWRFESLLKSWPWRWRQHIPPKYSWSPGKLQGNINLSPPLQRQS